MWYCWRYQNWMSNCRGNAIFAVLGLVWFSFTRRCTHTSMRVLIVVDFQQIKRFVPKMLCTIIKRMSIYEIEIENFLLISPLLNTRLNTMIRLFSFVYSRAKHTKFKTNGTISIWIRSLFWLIEMKVLWCYCSYVSIDERSRSKSTKSKKR